MYEVKLTASAQRDLNQLDPSVAAACLELIYGDLCASPRRVGKPLQGKYSGQWSARRGTYRVLYRIHDQLEIVAVTRIEHRRDAYH